MENELENKFDKTFDNKVIRLICVVVLFMAVAIVIGLSNAQ